MGVVEGLKSFSTTPSISSSTNTPITPLTRLSCTWFCAARFVVASGWPSAVLDAVKNATFVVVRFDMLTLHYRMREIVHLQTGQV